MFNVLVLGSSGQIGAYLTEYLRNKGHIVNEFDIVNDKQWQDLRMNNNTLLMEKVIASDFIFFLAFDVGGSRYLKNISILLISFITIQESCQMYLV